MSKDQDQDQARPWCGFCDERTRLLDQDVRVRRCPSCHPRVRIELAQHRRCRECRTVTYTWDTAPCGQHQLAGG